MARKTKDIKNQKVQDWANDLKNTYKSLINCADSARKLKKLLKTIDTIDKNNKTAVTKFKGDMVVAWKEGFLNANVLQSNLTTAFKQPPSNTDALDAEVNKLLSGGD